MKIALNALNMTTHRAGVGNYAFHVIKELQSLPSAHTFDVYVTNSVRDLFADSARMRFLTGGDFSTSQRRMLFELTGLSKSLNRGGYDLIHCLDYIAPLGKLQAPFLVTVHDVSFLVNKDYFTFSQGLTKKILLPHSVKRAAGVVTVSEFTKQELLRYVKLPKERVFPVLLGTDKPKIQGEGGIPCVLCVGTVEPRKNWIVAIQAMELLWERDSSFRLPLVIAGKNGWKYEPILEAAEKSKFRDRILFTGYCSEAQLAGWYQNAVAFLFPSFYEGFGLPPLEAMSYGVPVVASNAGSLPEVLGNGALFCPPEEAACFATGLEQAMGTERERLVSAGLHRAEELTWRNTGEGLLDCYETMERRAKNEIL